MAARYVSGRDPDIAQLEPYLLGTKDADDGEREREKERGLVGSPS